MTENDDKSKRGKDFDDRVKTLQKEGKTVSEIARILKCTDMRVTRSVLRLELRERYKEIMRVTK